MIAPGGGFSRQAYIFFDRLENLAWESIRRRLVGHVPPGACSSLILGVVLAHELGHLPLGSNSHSEKGIMRASWDPQALQDAYECWCGFTPDQVERLHDVVLARSEGKR